MKFDWKHWIPYFITWTLLLVLIGCSVWLIRNEIKKNQGPFFNYKASGSSKEPKLLFKPNKKPKGEKVSDKDDED